MTTELNLRFPTPATVIITFGDEASGELPFAQPFTEKDHADLRWYIETYGAHSLGDPDDKDAHRVRERLPQLGSALFRSVFTEREAQRFFDRFQDVDKGTRLLTITASQPEILGLPWELLRDPAGPGSYLFMERPPISIRRRVGGALGGRSPHRPEAKDRLHLLFVVSRPDDASFIDPRTDPGAVMDAIAAQAPGRVTTEFLRPPTLEALTRRLEDTSLPPVDILHFDGHGVFDTSGGIVQRLEKKQDNPAARTHADELLREDAPTTRQSAVPSPPNTGYLLFEGAAHGIDLVSAEQLGENLHRAKVALVILSACQSAAMSTSRRQDEKPAASASSSDAESDSADRPMGSVAARLTATGIPAVIAMTHSVLVATTRRLFGEFYACLARHEGIGEALDHARRSLRNDPFKYFVQRGKQRGRLELEDWFLPALYQQGADLALLGQPTAPGPADSALPLASNLPPQPEAGFFGRRAELWSLERWFVDGTRRVSITGFGGQGKTALAQEAGRWLLRTGMFRAVVFVDYFRDHSSDPVRAAINELQRVLDRSFTAEAEVSAALAQPDQPVLLILDNLEILSPQARQALFTAADTWSQQGRSRVLITSRQPEAGHPAWRSEGTLRHRALPLRGLGSRQRPDDALEWFAQLQQLPPAPQLAAPARDRLIDLFAQVEFHPLSIRVLAAQLKHRDIDSVGQGLARLLASAEVIEHRQKDDDTPAGLLASLLFSLHQLSPAQSQLVTRLGVFQGGAFEDDLLAITGLGESDGKREDLTALLQTIESGDVRAVLALTGQALPEGMELTPELEASLRPQLVELAGKIRADLAQLAPAASDNAWPDLRRELERAALIEPEVVAGVGPPYLRFHPTLAPLLASRLSPEEQQSLALAHRQRYYALANYLYREDRKSPHQARAIARRELPNLLHACHAALAAADPQAADFADSLNLFLSFFGLRQESEELLRQATALAKEAGSEAWHLAQSSEGERLLDSGQPEAARALFQQVLAHLGEAPSYERAVTLGRIGRCLEDSGRPDLAAAQQRAALKVLEALEPSDDVLRQQANRLTNLADSLMQMGDFWEARRAYEEGLEIDRKLQDERGEGVSLGQLGTLDMEEGNLEEAVTSFQKALALFQKLQEPRMEATAWHQLGYAFDEAKQWDEAERHYREAARIKEQMGDFASAATTWVNLANVTLAAGKLAAAEQWYLKALQHLEAPGDRATTLYNLASLLRSQPGRLAEARQHADAALAICLTLDPGAAEIWKTYNLLADIADAEAAAATEAATRQDRQAEARHQRQASRDTYRSYPAARTQLRKYAPLILATVAACQGQAEARALLAREQSKMRQGSSDWAATAAALDQIRAGQRQADILCADLGYETALLIEVILAGLADPTTLHDLLPNNEA